MNLWASCTILLAFIVQLQPNLPLVNWDQLPQFYHYEEPKYQGAVSTSNSIELRLGPLVEAVLSFEVGLSNNIWIFSICLSNLCAQEPGLYRLHKYGSLVFWPGYQSRYQDREMSLSSLLCLHFEKRSQKWLQLQDLTLLSQIDCFILLSHSFCWQPSLTATAMVLAGFSNCFLLLVPPDLESVMSPYCCWLLLFFEC